MASEYLSYLKNVLGVEYVPRGPQLAVAEAESATVTAQSSVGGLSSGGFVAIPHHAPSAKNAQMALVRGECETSQHCGLCQTRTNLVFGSGSADSQLMFVGEAPGENEDMQGAPFVGQAGDLLTRMVKAMGYGRDQIYIANVIKCRPPGNRNPTPEEVEGCMPFLKQQIEIVNPKVIVALGTFAAQALLKTEERISRLRGKVFEMGSVKVIPTFHPAYLLRNPDAKKEVWEDLKVAMGILKG